MHADRLLQIARDWFDETTVTQFFEPLLADWRRECAEAGEATRCLVRGYWAFWRTFAAMFPRRFFQPLHLDVTPSAWMLVELFASAGVLIVYAAWGAFDGEISFTRLLPSTLALALPFAVLPMSVILLTRPSFPAPDCRIAVARVVLIACLVMVPLIGWITPASTQSAREDVGQAGGLTHVRRGNRELTLPELIARTPPRDFRPSRLSRAAELQKRISLVLLPITLAALGCAVGRSGRRRGVLRAVIWWAAAPAILFAVLPLANALFTPRVPVGVWPAHAVFVIIAIVAGLKSRPTPESTWRAGL